MKLSNFKKLNIFKTNPLIGVVAIIEVIILICVSTFAWFVFADNNTVNTDIISVEPDSGLEIDFNDANENDYVNIWNYLNEFQFEPVTSLDGRNVFVPTTGTLNAINTSNMKFREATVNDMNSKYINIDFTLTNNGTDAMPVYLSSNSYFNLYDPDTKESIASKAIRIAFYQNDGESGRITSTLLSKEYDGDTPEDPDDGGSGGDSGGTYTVYLDAPSEWTDKSQIKAYVFGDSGNPVGFPGEVMSYDSSTGYYYYSADKKYDKVIFNYHGNQNQTVDLDVYDGGIYILDDGRNGTWALDNIVINGGTKVDGSGSNSGSDSGSSGDTGDSEGQTTVYFNNTLGWEQPYAYIWRENGSNDEALSSWPGKPMTHISGSIYYYTFNSKYDSIIFNDGNSQGGAVKTQDIYPVKDGYIYMIGNSTGDNEFGYTQEDYIGTVDGGTYPVISPGVSTGFQRPYAPVTQIDDNSGKSQVVVPAFASSIDDYNFGSEHSLFTIAPGQTLPLSMIIWLEGTDPDCTEDVYAGKFIDMNLVFATKDSGDKMYTYKFLDKTKENWIDDTIETDTGVSFDPVIQLYDVNSGKGYQMSVHDDEDGNPTIWQCSAPEALVNSDHIMFRRVNPMNEDEVWNYWDTSGFSGRDGAVVDSTVYFTAFSDGAPTNAVKDSNSTEESGAPVRSCGGLWGDHETQILTIYDGTEGQWIKDSTKEGTTSVLTMNYTYDGQTIEYKASGSGNDMYYFVVPKKVYSKTSSVRPIITFKRYYNFNSKYALNSDRNELTYHMKWNATACDGMFGQITGNNSGDFYWGSDILYVQARDIIKNKMSGSHLQVHFYSNKDGEEISGTSHYTTLYRNDNFASSGDGYGYACVVPSNKAYYKYRVERCKPDNTSEKWNITPLQSISSSTSNSDFSYLNTVSKNICTIDYMYLVVYFEMQDHLTNSNWYPECYAYNSSTSANNGWPGPTMEFVGNEGWGGDSSYQIFKCEINISAYDRIIFSNEYDGENRKFLNSDNSNSDYIVVGSDSDTNGMIYQGTGNYPNNIYVRKRSTVATGEPANETLHVTLYNSNDWP